MARKGISAADQQLKLPLFGVAAAVMLGLPTAGLAVAGLSNDDRDSASAFAVFTPASVDPELAARVADKARMHGFQFTPAAAGTVVSGQRTVTVAVRIDGETAQAISIRSATDAKPGAGTGIAGIQASRFNLGTARGYQSFARAQVTPARVSAVSLPEVLGDTSARNLSRNLSMPDLSEFELRQPSRREEPSRLQPRIELEGEAVAGRSPNTLDALSSQTVDVGGSFRLSPNFDVTAGVRLSQERDRLDPVTNSVQDSQAVYVGTQIRF